RTEYSGDTTPLDPAERTQSPGTSRAGLSHVGQPIPAPATVVPGTTDQKFTGCEDQFPGGQSPEFANRALVIKAVNCSGKTLTPLVSSGHLTRSNIEAAGQTGRRTDDFQADGRLSPDERAELSDYKGYVYVDRGHMAPHGDMPTRTTGSLSFLLSNMVPQAAC